MFSATMIGLRVFRVAQNTGLQAASRTFECLPFVRAIHSGAVLRASAEKVSSPIFNVQDEEDFKKRVLESSTPVIVDFHATWCGPCKLLGPRLEALVSAKKGQITMAKIDIDEQSDLAFEYKVRSVPTVLAFKKGKVVDQFVGLADDARVSEVIDKLLAK